MIKVGILSTLICLIGYVAATAYADNQVSLFSAPNKDTKLDKYIEEMTFCFDSDSDGKLGSEELKVMVKAQLGEAKCQAQYKKFDSKLVTDKDMHAKLQKLLGFEDKTMRLNLLYRASRDTCNPNVFHSKVDGLYGTVTLISSPNGQIFGGYLSIATDAVRSGYIRDSKAFLFSLSKNERYNVIDPNRAYYNDPSDKDAYMNFGKDDLVVLKGCRGQTYYFGEDF